MIPLKDIHPGFYVAAYENKPGSKLIVKVYGREGFYRIDAWEDILSPSGILISNMDIEKRPIVFINRITELDKGVDDG